MGCRRCRCVVVVVAVEVVVVAVEVVAVALVAVVCAESENCRWLAFRDQAGWRGMKYRMAGRLELPGPVRSWRCSGPLTGPWRGPSLRQLNKLVAS